MTGIGRPCSVPRFSLMSGASSGTGHSGVKAAPFLRVHFSLDASMDGPHNRVRTEKGVPGLVSELTF
jgi:hypothetical protein